jgi:predicted nucleic acid-binding protein
VRVVLDLNVVLDFLLARKQFLGSAEILLLAENRKIDAYLPLHGVSTVYYFCRKQYSDETSRKQISTLVEIATVISIDNEGLHAAINSPIGDFEDALVVETARFAKADYIISRNTSDYKNSDISAVTPEQFIERYFSSLQ